VDEIDEEAVVLNAGGQRTVVPLRIFDNPVAGKRPAARPAGQRRPEAARRPPAKPAAPEAGAAPAVEGQPPRRAVPREASRPNNPPRTSGIRYSSLLMSAAGREPRRW